MTTMTLGRIEEAVYLCHWYRPVFSDVIRIENGNIYFENGEVVSIDAIIAERDAEVEAEKK